MATSLILTATFVFAGCDNQSHDIDTSTEDNSISSASSDDSKPTLDIDYSASDVANRYFQDNADVYTDAQTTEAQNDAAAAFSQKNEQSNHTKQNKEKTQRLSIKPILAEPDEDETIKLSGAEFTIRRNIE